jgi:signal transduction histidine kinase/CheY-like chemotaxis protein
MIANLSERAIILAPNGRDAAIAASLLNEAGMRSVISQGLPEFVATLAQGAGFAILTEEALRTANLQPLAQWLDDQPEWSDFPFVLLTRKGGGIERNPAAKRFLDTLGNVTFLERPFHPTTLVSLAQSALRGRRRQYDARARLDELRRGAKKYRSLFDSIEAGFAIITMMYDEAGDPVDYVIDEANPAFERLTGYVDAPGKSIMMIQPDYDPDRLALYDRVARSREPIRFEYHAHHFGDRWFDIFAFPASNADDAQVAVLFNDITARRHIEIALRESEERLRALNETLEQRVIERTCALEEAQEALRQSQKLESMGQLTGGVAHDFNNLLTPIVGSLDILQRRGIGGEREQRLIEGAIQSAERARMLVQRLLAFARRQPLQATAIDLRGLIENLQGLISSTCGPRIRLSIEITEELPPARADANQIEMALLNLAVNARDAMPDGGTLTIAAERERIAGVHVAALTEGDYVHLRMADTGAGMNAETRAKAIEPFFTTKGVGQGTGLGLSMVHGLAAQLGGGLAIDSAPGQGTTIHLWLPVTQAQPDRATHAAAPHSQCAHRGTALVVDDEALVRTSTADMLSELGYRVIEAESAEDALSRFALAGDVALLVTDHMMPGMTGTALAATIRERSPATRVLIISGYADVEGISPDMQRLAKPFKQSDLAHSIERL